MSDSAPAESEPRAGDDAPVPEESPAAASSRQAGEDGHTAPGDVSASEQDVASEQNVEGGETDRRQRLTAALRLGLPDASAPDGGGGGGSKEKEPERQPDPRSLYNRLTAFETVLLTGGVGLFLMLLYTMWGFLSPPLLALAGGLLLWPLREHHTVRAVMVSGGFLLLLWLLADLSAILLPFGLIYVLAYLFDPFVAYLHRRFGISRRLSSLLITALV
ncbi:MAG: hypothetical protein BRD46_05135, partial [Bacteroidetes bacterium QS_8_68_15]